jgi:hypothetical protein
MNKKFKIILVILIVLAVSVSGGLAYWILCRTDDQAVATSSPSISPSESWPAEQAQTGPGWSIYKNFVESFLIEYPDGATVANASSSAAETNKKATEAPCVKISTKYYSVTVESRNVTDDTTCLKTDFGADWLEAPSESIDGVGGNYTATGFKTEAASAGDYNDFYTIYTPSDYKIQYGISVNEKNDPAMTKAQAKEIVHKIVASFSPAE